MNLVKAPTSFPYWQPAVLTEKEWCYWHKGVGFLHKVLEIIDSTLYIGTKTTVLDHAWKLKLNPTFENEREIMTFSYIRNVNLLQTILKIGGIVATLWVIGAYTTFIAPAAILSTALLVKGYYKKYWLPSGVASKPFITEQPIPVGRLGKDFNFPSDHFYVKFLINDLKGMYWNVLDKQHLHHIESDSQGLSDSSIMNENILQGSLTVREKTIAGKIAAKLIDCDFVALGEVSQDLFNVLKTVLPWDKFGFFPDDFKQSTNGDIFIYKKERLNPDKSKIPMITEYQCHKKSQILSLHLTKNGKKYLVIQTHTPGGPNGEKGCAELAAILAVARYVNRDSVMILMGDMNRPPSVLMSLFEQERSQFHLGNFFEPVPIPYPTHINTHKEASWIDNLFVSPPPGYMAHRTVFDIDDGLKPTMDLIKSKTVQK